MFKRIVLLSFAVLLIGASVSWAQTRIHNLPYTITTSGSYDIDTDLTSTGSGITVSADNVTIDLKGYSLIGSGTGKGIDIGLSSNVEVRNGTVTNFAEGIFVDEAPLGARIIDMRITNNTINGLTLDIGGIVRNCVISGNGGKGIWALESVVQGNSIFENGSDGIAVWSSTILDNNITTNGGYGIRAGASTIKNNIAKGNASGGIHITAGDNMVDGNTAVYNTNVNMTSCSSCTFGTNHAP